MGTNKAVAIATDIMNSRSIDIDPILMEIKTILNDKYKAFLVTPFEIRLGDELIGVLSKFSETYNVLQDLDSLMKQFKIRMYVGIGFGVIDTDELRDIHRVNGSAIRSATRARDVLKKNLHSQQSASRRKDLLHKSNLFISSYAEEKEIPYRAINYYIGYLQDKIEKRTAAQKEVIQIYEKHPQLTLEEIGEKIGHSKSGVSNLLKRSDYQNVLDAQKAFQQLLDYIQDHYPENESDGEVNP